MEKVDLILDRAANELWIDDETHISCLWDVTGVERISGSVNKGVRIIRHGRMSGIVWSVEEIKEQW